MTDTAKLRALMLNRGYTQEALAAKMGISAQSLNYKLNNRREFKASEICMLIRILDIANESVEKIFFTQNVDL